MIKLQGKLPREVNLAISGGIDSVAALDFLANNHKVNLIHVNHKEGNSDTGQAFVEWLASYYSINLETYDIDPDKPKGYSQEEWWRIQRYEIFHSLDKEVITCHHLDDCVETWIWSSLHGIPKIIPYRNRNVIRPFRLTSKDDFRAWVKRKSLAWVEDESNADTNLTRNYIRNVMMPHVLKVNSGIQTVIYKKVYADVPERLKGTDS